MSKCNLYETWSILNSRALYLPGSIYVNNYLYGQNKQWKQTNCQQIFSIFHQKQQSSSDSRQSQFVCQGVLEKNLSRQAKFCTSEKDKIFWNKRQFPGNYQALCQSKRRSIWLDEILESMASETTTQGTLLTGSAERYSFARVCGNLMCLVC